MIPAEQRLRLAHATIQYVADELGARALHVKGPALHSSLLHRDADGNPQPRISSDADVLIDPRHARAVFRRLQQVGWHRYATFATGSPFGHAATVWHDQLGYADIHRKFPGIGIPDGAAFDAMWRDRQFIALGHRVCPVPSVEHQRFLLLLHSARSAARGQPDVDVAWRDASDEDRRRTREVAAQFDAELPLAAAIGELDRYRGNRRYALWAQFSSDAPASRSAEWRARLLAASTPVDAAKIALRSLLVNTDHLAVKLGHAPSRMEMFRAWIDRFRRAVDENVHKERS